MSIRKREWVSPEGGKRTAWLVDYKDQSGKRRAKQFRTKKEADEYADRTRTEIRQGIHTHDRDSITLADAATLRIQAAEAEDLERSTIKRYGELHRIHIVPRFSERKLSSITKAELIDFRQDLLKKLSRSMASKVLRELSAVLSHAQQLGAIAQNVASDVKIARASRDKALILPPSRADLKKMIAAATDTERPFILTAILTGLRSSELRGLRWQDIDLAAGSITVRQRADQWGTIGSPKSDAGKRTIPIPPELVAELKRWKLRCPHSRMGLAFPSGKGTPLRHNNILRRLYFPLQVRAGLGVPKIGKSGELLKDENDEVIQTGMYGFHDLRHAAASGWIANNIDLKRLQAWLGHKNIQITLDTYGHLLIDQERDAELAMKASRDLFA